VASKGTGRIGRQIRICLFDIMGTVVDVAGSVRQDTTAVLRRAGIKDEDAHTVIGRSEQRLGELMADVTAGRRDWQGH